MKTKKVETAVIIGAGSGMGQAVAKKLALDGVQVFLADLNIDSAKETLREIKEIDDRVEAFMVDVSQSASVIALFEAMKERVDRLDMIVNTAAIMGDVAFIEDIDDTSWRKMLAVNLDGTFYCCREAVRWMKEYQTGRIILFSSIASQTPTPGSLPYSTAKAGVNMLAKTLAKEVAKHNIRVNVIAPGYIKTPMLNNLPDGFMDYVYKKTPLKRLGDVEEIAALVSFLASSEADYFTGQIFCPNGGFVI
ncbi:MAG: SDR family NAD(P)-dependent oxidoreductase [Promethearchaeota archaeon]